MIFPAVMIKGNSHLSFVPPTVHITVNQKIDTSIFHDIQNPDSMIRARFPLSGISGLIEAKNINQKVLGK